MGNYNLLKFIKKFSIFPLTEVNVLYYIVL